MAARFAATRYENGSEWIFYSGGAGQGNHLPALYGQGATAALQRSERER